MRYTNNRLVPPPIVITAGEPAGIGPDLCVMLAQDLPPEPLVVVADQGLLEQRARCLRLPFRAVDPGSWPAPGERGVLPVIHSPLAVTAVAGKLNVANAGYVLGTIEQALQGCLNGRFAAMVTAPVHKGVINDAGITFTGHTEFLAEHTGTPHVVMMLVGGGLRVALATTHVAVRDIADHITSDGLERTIRILCSELAARFGIRSPRVVVAGLNPHAGEGGHLGREEMDIMIPLLDRLRCEGMRLAGPLPADTMFNPERLRDCDCVLAMYHDQGLPVLKYASFGGGVNVTLGLPIIRTSVDHGTALDLAGRGGVEVGSLRAAITLAAVLARNQALN